MVLKFGDRVRVNQPGQVPDLDPDPHHGRAAKVIEARPLGHPGDPQTYLVGFADGLQRTYLDDELVPAEFETPPAADGEIGLLLEEGRRQLQVTRDAEAATRVIAGEAATQVWQGFLASVLQDLGPALGPHVGRNRPDGFDADTETWAAFVDVPGIGGVARFYKRADDGWHPYRLRVGGVARGKWGAVAQEIFFEPNAEKYRIRVAPMRDWHWCETVAEALALAEEETRRLPELQAEAARREKAMERDRARAETRAV
jgi:hypothetical protein